MTQPPRRAVLYTRVSTALQERDGVSLDNQQDMARRYCALRGWSLVESYTDVQSGRDKERPELQRLERDMRNRAFDVVLCYKLDRLSRNVGHFHELLGKMEAAGIDLAALTQEFDTSTPMGRLMLNILISIAQMESETTGERVADTIKYQARQGRQLSRHHAPYGYRYVRQVAHEDGSKTPARYELHDGEAPIVARLFELFLALRSTKGVANALSGEGLIPREGGMWWASNILKILNNPVYAGNLAACRFEVKRKAGKKVIVGVPRERWIVTPGAAPAIVSLEVWEACQAIIRENATQHPRSLSGVRIHPWSGLLRCGLCSSSMVRAKKRDRGATYRCGRARESNKRVCSGVTVSDLQLEHILLPALFAAAEAWNAKARGKQPAKKLPRPASDRAGQVRKLEEDKGLLLDALLARGISKEAYHKRLTEIDRKLDALAQEPREAAPPPVEFPENLGELWAGLPVLQRGDLLRLLVSHITVSDEGLRLEWAAYDPPIAASPLVLEKRRIRTR